MPQKYNFTRTESGGTEFVLAKPRTETEETVRLRADWVKGDEIEGEWERAVRAMIQTDLMGEMELEEGDGRLSKRRAIQVLADAEDDEGQIVTSETQAEALIEYFETEGILKIEGDQVILLKHPQENDVSQEMMLNWAAGIDACVSKITETIERVENAKERLQEHLDKLKTSENKIEERIKETAQSLESLGDEQGAPTDISELAEEEQERYEDLTHELIYHQTMNEVDTKNLVKNVEAGTSQLAQNIDMLKSAREALEGKRMEVRTLALQRGIFPEDAINIVNNMGKLATQLAGVGDIEKKVAEATPEEVAEMVSEVTGEVEQVTETAQETATDTEEATDFQV